MSQVSPQVLSSGEALRPTNSEKQDAICEIEASSCFSEGVKVEREEGESSGVKNTSFDNVVRLFRQTFKCSHCIEAWKHGSKSRKRGRDTCIIKTNGMENRKKVEDVRKRLKHLEISGDGSGSECDDGKR